MKTVCLKDICENSIGTLKKNNTSNIEYVDISSVSNISKKIESTQRFNTSNAPSRAKQLIKQGDVLVSTVRPNLNAVAMVNINSDDTLVASTGFCVLRCKKEVLNKYVFYFCQSQSFIDDMVSQASGASYPAVTASIVKNAKLPFVSLETQKAVTDTLDKVTFLIDKRKEQLEKLDKLVKARFIELFGGVHDSKIYPYRIVKDFTDVVSGGTPSRDNHEFWNGGTIPWVKTTELQNNVIDNVEEHITEAGLNNSSAKIVPAETILIAMYGQGKTRGMTAYLSIEACTNQACACILPNSEINQKYLWQYFILSYDNLRDMAKGGNQPNLNGNIIKNYPVLFPPIELQNQFAAFVEQTDKSKSVIQKSLEKLETLKKSLMQKYFG